MNTERTLSYVSAAFLFISAFSAAAAKTELRNIPGILNELGGMASSHPVQTGKLCILNAVFK